MRSITVIAVISALLMLLIPSWAAADTADDVKCTGCVGSPDILDFGVKTKDLGVGAVTTPKINDGAVNWKKLASDLQDRIEQLEATVTSLEEALTQNTVLKLDGYLDLDTTDPSKPTARFTGVNVQVVNGANVTSSTNGLGNLLVGYDEQYPSDDFICSFGDYDTQEDCESIGAVWAVQHKSGSHNLVVGAGHRYSRSGGLIGGAANTVNGDSASVTGGQRNIASEWVDSVAGGYENHASGSWSAVSGGYFNRTEGIDAVVSGGHDNEARAYDSVVSGGLGNTASGIYSVAGGGHDREASGDHDWVAGALWQDQ